MTDAELLGRWFQLLAVAAVVVAVVAALLITILVMARRIARAAGRCLAAVKQIDDHTRAIWELDATNAAAWQLRETVRSIRERAEEIAEALQAPAGPRA